MLAINSSYAFKQGRRMTSSIPNVGRHNRNPLGDPLLFPMNSSQEVMNKAKTEDLAERQNSSKFSALILLTMAQFLVVLDLSIVTIALPSIIKGLGTSVSLVQWVVSAYGLTLAGFLLLSGRLGDTYGHKRLFAAGLVIFSLASLASGLAPSIGLLIAARAVQGVGAAIGSATGLSILVAIFPEGPERNKALGIFGAVMGSGFIMGMISGGIITTFLGWRWVFGVTVPIGLAAAAFSARVIRVPPPPSDSSIKSRPDFLGAVTFTAGLMLLVYALTSIQTGGYVSLQTIELVLLSALIFGVFATIESGVRKPLLPLSFVRRRLVLTANSVALMTLAAFIGEIFLITIYLQQILGYTPLNAGLAFAPGGLVFFIVSGFLGAKFVNQFGVRKSLIVGEGVTLLGYLVMTLVSVSSNYLALVVGTTIAIGFGLGLAFPAYNIAALMGAKKGEAGLASGIINTSRMIGGPIGVAALVSITTLFDPVTREGVALNAGLQIGLNYGFIGAVAFAIAAVVLSFLIKVKRIETEPETPDSFEV
jgi:EmrB/QacA subfamily drug resistance transporter